MIDAPIAPVREFLPKPQLGRSVTTMNGAIFYLFVQSAANQQQIHVMVVVANLDWPPDFRTSARWPRAEPKRDQDQVEIPGFAAWEAGDDG
jgi:hypothetical protein